MSLRILSEEVGIIANGVSAVADDGYEHLTEHLPTFQPLVVCQAVPQIHLIAHR
jgi:hypothetical protein